VGVVVVKAGGIGVVGAVAEEVAEVVEGCLQGRFLLEGEGADGGGKDGGADRGWEEIGVVVD